LCFYVIETVRAIKTKVIRAEMGNAKVLFILRMYQGVEERTDKSRRLPTQKIKIEKSNV
jgi:hypothetical protein